MNFEDVYFNFTRSYRELVIKITMIYSRLVALKYKRATVRKKGFSVVDGKTKKAIKDYSRERFGKATYWPYLALYSEIRGQFIKGWMPYDYFRYVLLPEMNPPTCCAISEQKTFDYRIFGDFVKKPLFVYISGMYMTANMEVVSLAEVKKFFSDYNDMIVVKEENGTKGKQVKFLHSSEFKPEKLNERQNYVISPCIKQYKTLGELYPNSVNTFRVTTYYKKDGTVEVKFTVLRFGVDGLKIDNISSGGQFIYFDKNGTPSDSAFDIMGNNLGNQHKNTGFVFAELKVPMFNEIMEKCKSAHRKYPYTRLIGWDVCVEESGEPKLIEWNADNPGFWFWEDIFGPFWPDDSEF
jgi:hypothetical protein